MTQIHPENSPDESFRQDGRINVNSQATLTGERTKGWFTNVLLALCICALIASFFMWRYGSMIQDLKRYDLDNFKQTEFAELKAQVLSDHELIQAYGLQKVVRETVKENEIGRPRDYKR